MEKQNIEIVNKAVEFKVIGQKTNYFEMSIASLEGLKPEGITTGGMRTLFKTIDKLEENKSDNSTVQLTKQEAQALLNSVKNMSWQIVDRQIIEFEDYINKLIK